jgi:hypothetical protein
LKQNARLDAAILPPVSSSTTYSNLLRARMPGGDAARRTYLFEAVSRGSATITYRKIFRGHIEELREIEVTVRG